MGYAPLETMLPVVSDQAANAVTDWWSGAYAAYDPKNAADYAGSKADKTGNGRTGVDIGGAVTLLLGSGWKFDVAGRVISIPVQPAGTWSIIVKFSSAPDGLACLFGTANSGNTSYYIAYPRYTAKILPYWASTGDLVPVSAELTAGTIGFADRKIFRNGAHVATMATAGVAAQRDLFIGGFNNSGSPIQIFSGGIISSLVVFDYTLPDEEMNWRQAAMS